MTDQSVPQGSDIRAFKNEAKSLLKRLKAGYPDAAERVRPYFDSSADAKLTQMQLVVAREVGFDSWAKLRDHLGTAASTPAFAAYQGDEPFVFVSYAPADSQHVCPELQLLHEQSVNICYDAGAVLDAPVSVVARRRLEQRAPVVLFKSRASAESRHCREIESLARSLRPPPQVIPIYIEQTGSLFRLWVKNHQLPLADFRAALAAAMSNTQPPVKEDPIDGNDELLVVRFINKVIMDAITDEADSIRFSCNSEHASVECQLATGEREVSRPPAEFFPSIMARLKVMSALDASITDHDEEWEGTIKLKLSDALYYTTDVQIGPNDAFALLTLHQQDLH